jgi:hypothetical protein
MKILIITFFIVNFLTVCISHAQTTTPVAPGDGTLAAAIETANPGDILQLTGGADYT